MGKDYVARGQYAPAEAHLRSSLEIRRRHLRTDHPEVARAQSALAGCLIELRRYGEAAALLHAADATLSVQFAATDERVQEVRALLAKLAAARGHSAAAARE